MLVHIPEVLSKAEVAEVRKRLAAAGVAAAPRSTSRRPPAGTTC